MNRNERKLRPVTDNPCNMCMPMGALIPFKGMEDSMVIIHGSQGCATYMRRHMAEHFNEPVDVASSSITEQGTVYGGEANLKRGLENLLKLYNPRVVGILSTCLAETIGEDTARTAGAFRKEKGEDLKARLITVSTPGYGGSHTEGYFRALTSIVKQVCKKSAPNGRINVIVPHISPADIREIKRILDLMEVSFTLLPDISDTLDSPYTRTYRRIPAGGTALADIETMPGAMATVQFARTVADELSPGKYLENEYGVPLYQLPLPMGVTACDQLLEILSQLTGKPIPDGLKKEKGRLLDAMIDSHKYNREGRAAVFGEPETVLGVLQVLVENGVNPSVLATGSKSPGFRDELQSVRLDGEEDSVILMDSDFTDIRRECEYQKVNLAIGNSDGRILSERDGIPLVRIGFPIHDRVGGQRLLSVGYAGTTLFLDRITNTLLAQKLSQYRQGMVDRFYHSPAAGHEDLVWRNSL